MNVKKAPKYFLFAIIIFAIIAISYFFIGSPEPQKEIIWGVNFSQGHAEYLGLDWRKIYSALIDVLEVKEIKIMSQWDLIENFRGEFGDGDADIIRNIVLAWLAEKSFISTVAKNKLNDPQNSDRNGYLND